MFVSNRFDNSAPELSGSITRILHPEGAWTPNGTITSPLFSQPHLSAFRGGELFVAQRGFNNNFVLRFVFDATGAATFNGVINTGLTFAAPCGAAVSPSGELFIAQGCGVNQINRYLFDSAGDAIPNGTITGPTVCGPGAMAFSATGELFGNNPCADAVSRFTFDSSGNVSANGLITAPTLHSPQGVAFSPWGELFVSNLNLPSVISRWTFDNAGNAVFNGSFALPQATADLRFGPSAEPPPNRPPDCSHVTLTPAQLWPPNHRYVDVTATGATDADAGDTATIATDSVTQDEPVDGRGDGHTAPDAKLTAPRSDHVAIRAERSTFGDGRVYRVHTPPPTPTTPPAPATPPSASPATTENPPSHPLTTRCAADRTAALTSAAAARGPLVRNGQPRGSGRSPGRAGAAWRGGSAHLVSIWSTRRSDLLGLQPPGDRDRQPPVANATDSWATSATVGTRQSFPRGTRVS